MPLRLLGLTLCLSALGAGCSNGDLRTLRAHLEAREVGVREIVQVGPRAFRVHYESGPIHSCFVCSDRGPLDETRCEALPWRQVAHHFYNPPACFGEDVSEAQDEAYRDSIAEDESCPLHRLEPEEVPTELRDGEATYYAVRSCGPTRFHRCRPGTGCQPYP